MTGEILFLAHRVPYPPNRGDKIRSWHLLRHMAQIAPTHVCALWDDARDLEHRETIDAVAASVTLEPQNPSRLHAMAKALVNGKPASVMACASATLQRRVDHLLASRPIATVFAFSGQMAQFVPAQLPGRRFVMDFVDMDSAKFAAFGGFANAQEGKRLRAWEQSVAARADLSLFVSRAEADLFRGAAGAAAGKVDFIENGIDLDHFHPQDGKARGDEARPLIVFTGQMDYRPNVDAVTQFAREAMPQIRAGSRNARFAIVGRNPSPEVQALAALPGVEVTGEVADTRVWLADAQVVVAPLLLARGIQNKVLEAMAMAKAVVTSPAAAEGIDAAPGRELVIADGPAAQAEAITTLLRNPAMAPEIGAAARARMVAHYSWEARLQRLPQMLGFA